MPQELTPADGEIIKRYVEELAAACPQPRPFCFGWAAKYSDPLPEDKGPIVELTIHALVDVSLPLAPQCPRFRINTLLNMFDTGPAFGGHYQLLPRGGMMVLFGHYDNLRIVLSLQTKMVFSIDYEKQKVETIEPEDEPDTMEKVFFV